MCVYIYIYIYIESGYDGEQGTHTKLVPVQVDKTKMEKKEQHKERQVNFLNRESNLTAVSS